MQNEVQPITILYPRYNARLWLPRDFGGRLQEIVLRVAHRDGTRQLFWYLDDRFLGTTQDRHMRSAPMDQGWHILEVVDETGHRDRTRFYVDRMPG